MTGAPPPASPAERPLAVAGARLFVLDPRVDDRGAFAEAWRSTWADGFAPAQANLSWSEAGVLRGLHYHRRQADLWVMVAGRARIVLADLRGGAGSSPERSEIEVDTDEERIALFIPPGVAHGFYARSEMLLLYLVDRAYDGTDEFGIAWDDPSVGHTWPTDAPVLSDRDRSNPSLAEALAGFDVR